MSFLASTLSQFWLTIQATLFPWLEEELGELSEKQQQTMSLQEMLDDLPQLCDSGSKLNSRGYPVSWNGYKLHLDVADGQIPISCLLTSASVYDNQVALPLATMSAQRVTNLYDLM